MAGSSPPRGPSRGADHGRGRNGAGPGGGRSRSPRMGAGTGSGGPWPRASPETPGTAGPPPDVRGLTRSPDHGAPAAPQATGTLPRGWWSTAPGNAAAPQASGIAPDYAATAAALTAQLPLQQAAVAASQAARVVAGAPPTTPSPRTGVVSAETSLAILEAQVGAMGSLLLALQGIVLQLVAVVNLLRAGR